MEKVYKFIMDKHLRTKGFTLVEMLIVLSVLAMLLAIVPFVRPVSNGALHYQMTILHQTLVEAQTLAMNSKQKVSINVKGSYMEVGDTRFAFQKGVTCNATSLHFTAQGNVNKAQTIVCTSKKQSRSLVILLGSGRMYVK